LALAGIRPAWRDDRMLAIFACLVVLGLVGGIATMFYWADEVWGPRYLHSAVAPLMLLVARSRDWSAFPRRRLVPLLGPMLLITWGLAVSFLGAFFYYLPLQRLAMETESPTLEQLQSEVTWNPIRFHLQLMKLWVQNSLLDQGADQEWPPPGHAWWPTVLEH